MEQTRRNFLSWGAALTAAVGSSQATMNSIRWENRVTVLRDEAEVWEVDGLTFEARIWHLQIPRGAAPSVLFQIDDRQSYLFPAFDDEDLDGSDAVQEAIGKIAKNVRDFPSSRYFYYIRLDSSESVTNHVGVLPHQGLGLRHLHLSVPASLLIYSQ